MGNQDSGSGMKRGKAMNAAKVTLTSTILAATLGLALGLMSAPAAAHDCSRHGDPNHKHCDSEPETTFAVSLSFLTVPPGPSATNCPGTTDIQANPGLTVQMIPDPFCSVLMTAAPEGLSEVEFRPAILEVKTKKELTLVRLYFTTGLILFPVSNDTVYVTDFMTATINDGPLEGQFILTPMTATDGEKLTKVHQPGKRAVTDERVMIGAFTYTPDP